ncbi:MAG TPA: WecB/TagA/CpsF family glycosyltransferase, partial [Thermoguttaceae bacterium]|nr:WecB/TagA/CpsF family glycosyltransferase [Thermoguttaceae bacterium]
EGVAERAATKVMAKWPHVEIVGTYSPPMGFEHDEKEEQEVLDRVNAVKPDFLVVGLGAPKQELFVHKHRKNLQAAVAVCVGGTIDYLAGDLPRAPLWMRNAGLEWFYRCLTEPKRLAPRYFHDAWHFPGLLWKEFSSTLRHSHDAEASVPNG